MLFSEKQCFLVQVDLKIQLFTVPCSEHDVAVIRFTEHVN